MKKLVLAIGVLGASLWALTAQTDPVLMSVAGKDVQLSEFEYLYNKNNSQQVQPQTLDEYVEMFVNYKLKVADAEAAGIDTTAELITGFHKFRNELAAPYLRDEAVFEQTVREAYEHLANEVTVSHIMMAEADQAKLDSIRNEILAGNLAFETAARKYSIDRGSSQRGGLMGVVLGGRYPKPFEDAAFATAVGEISPVVNSGYGVHIIRVENRRPSRGEVLCEHILLRVTPDMNDDARQAVETRIDSIYRVVSADTARFEELARTLSQDPGSAARGGRLNWFGSGMMVAPFDSVSFALNVGEVSNPFRTAFGWHIIRKLDARSIASYEEMHDQLAQSIQGNNDMPRLAFIARKAQEYQARLLEDNLDKVENMAENSGAVLDSTMLATFARCDLPIYIVRGDAYTLAEMVPALPVSAVRGGANIRKFIAEQAQIQMNEVILEYARQELYEINADYRNLVNEYRDGILLFEISNRTVWDRASKDREGLEAFFQRNKDRYAWSQPKFKSYIIFATNDSILAEAAQFGYDSIPSTTAPADVVKAFRTRFGRDVKVERVIAAQGENAITDYLAFGGERPASANAHWPSYRVFRGRIIDAPEEASDVRGTVISDYQAELEQQWLQQLRQRYPVTINREVLQQVK
ncbi:MAG: peptidylprolyl isomerase [Muribaculaceae bacterium]